MTQFFTGSRFYPQNFLFKAPNSNAAESIARLLSEQAAQLAPDCFTGEDKFFTFELRYCPPYEHKSFNELRRLQAEARQHTRFKDEYHGFILLDVDAWSGHYTEELFSEVVSSFLMDMADCWKYIFTCRDDAHDNELHNTLSRKLWIKELDAVSLLHDLPTASDGVQERLKADYDITTDSSFNHFVHKLAEIGGKENSDIVRTVMQDLTAYFGEGAHIGMTELSKYILDNSTLAFSLLEGENISELIKEVKEEIAC